MQFELLHSKYHLCTPTTRQLLLSTYVKFINLFPELKETIVEVLSQDSNYRSSNVEIQQRSVEYLVLSKIVTEDILVSSWFVLFCASVLKHSSLVSFSPYWVYLAKYPIVIMYAFLKQLVLLYDLTNEISYLRLRSKPSLLLTFYFFMLVISKVSFIYLHLRPRF